MDWKIEVVMVPVSDVERAKRFYGEQLGFTVDRQLRRGLRRDRLLPQRHVRPRHERRGVRHGRRGLRDLPGGRSLLRRRLRLSGWHVV